MSGQGYFLGDDYEAPSFTAFSGRAHRLLADEAAAIPDTQVEDAEEETTEQQDDEDVIMVGARLEGQVIQQRMEELRTMVAAWLCSARMLLPPEDPLLVDLDGVMMQLAMFMSKFNPETQMRIWI